MAELADNVRAYLEEVRLAVFGSINRDGSPHLAGLWYQLRDNTIILNTGTASRKVRNLKRDPRASVCVIDHAAARHVTVEGTVTFDEEHVLEDLVSLASRYAGPEAGARIAENIARVPHVTLILSIDTVNTFGKI
jgi:PPOX class probable F420-dependent enzyme